MVVTRTRARGLVLALAVLLALLSWQPADAQVSCCSASNESSVWYLAEYLDTNYAGGHAWIVNGWTSRLTYKLGCPAAGSRTATFYVNQTVVSTTTTIPTCTGGKWVYWAGVSASNPGLGLHGAGVHYKVTWSNSIPAPTITLP